MGKTSIYNPCKKKILRLTILERELCKLLKNMQRMGAGKERKGRGRGKTERYWANPEGTGCLTGDLGHVH